MSEDNVLEMPAPPRRDYRKAMGWAAAYVCEMTAGVLDQDDLLFDQVWDGELVVVNRLSGERVLRVFVRPDGTWQGTANVTPALHDFEGRERLSWEGVVQA